MSWTDNVGLGGGRQDEALQCVAAMWQLSYGCKFGRKQPK